MKNSDIVKSKKTTVVGDEALRMVSLENPNKGIELVEAIADMSVNPTYRHKTEKLEVFDEISGSTKDNIPS